MINFTKVTATGLLMMTVAFESMAVDHLAIIGGATPGGWEIGDGLLMLPDSENPDVFNFTGYLKAEEEFKFTAGRDFSDPTLEYRNESSDPYDVSKLVQGGGATDNKFKVKESANYNVVCNLADMTVSVAKAEYQENPIRFNALFLVGNATDGGWEIADGTLMTWVGGTDPFKFTYSGDLKEGEFKITSNRYNGSWDCPWFFAGVDEAGNIDYSKISPDGNGDRKWQVAAAGRYNIETDLLNGSFAITNAPQNAIEAVDADIAGTPVYYNLQGMIVSNPSNGIFIKQIGDKITKVIL